MNDENFKEGYTLIDNRIIEALTKTNFNGSQAKIVFCILRATYGFNKKGYDMSLSFIAKATGLSRSKVSVELKNLAERNIIKIYKNNTFSNAKNIGINKKISQWVLSKTVTVTENDNRGVTENGNRTVTENGNQKIHNKNTYIKNHISTPAVYKYDDVFLSFWEMYPKKVAKIRCYEYFREADLYDEIGNITKGLKHLIEVDYSKKERQYIPDPITFLVDERWKDYKEERKEDEINEW